MPRLSASALTVAVGLLAGCSGNSATTTSPTTSTPSASISAPTSTTSTTIDAGAQAIAGYRAFWDAYVVAADPMDPQNPRLAATAINPELETVQRSFLAHRGLGEVIRGSIELHPHVVSASEQEATVKDCYLDRTHVFKAATGAQVDPPADQSFLVTATVVLQDGAWKVSTVTKEGEGCTPE